MWDVWGCFNVEFIGHKIIIYLPVYVHMFVSVSCVLVRRCPPCVPKNIYIGCGEISLLVACGCFNESHW